MSEPTEQSQGQKALERLLAVQTRFMTARGKLRTTLASIGGKASPAAAPAESCSGRQETRFFPALDELTQQLDREAAAIEADINDLARRF